MVARGLACAEGLTQPDLRRYPHGHRMAWVGAQPALLEQFSMPAGSPSLPGPQPHQDSFLPSVGWMGPYLDPGLGRVGGSHVPAGHLLNILGWGQNTVLSSFKQTLGWALRLADL